MSTLTIRLPDDKHERLRQLAQHRQISVNKLMEELASISIAEFEELANSEGLALILKTFLSDNNKLGRLGDLRVNHGFIHLGAG